MKELKPCPFCGGKALLSHDHAGIEASYVRCEKCGLESIRFLKSFECASDDRAVEFWNRRADADCIRYMDAADVAPVRHGRWNADETCSCCGEKSTEGLDAEKWNYWLPDYCPNCGAKMDLED